MLIFSIFDKTLVTLKVEDVALGPQEQHRHGGMGARKGIRITTSALTHLICQVGFERFVAEDDDGNGDWPPGPGGDGGNGKGGESGPGPSHGKGGGNDGSGGHHGPDGRWHRFGPDENDILGAYEPSEGPCYMMRNPGAIDERPKPASQKPEKEMIHKKPASQNLPKAKAKVMKSALSLKTLKSKAK